MAEVERNDAVLRVQLAECERLIQQLQQEKVELERLNQLMMGREERILDLKQAINALLKELGRPVKYGV